MGILHGTSKEMINLKGRKVVSNITLRNYGSQIHRNNSDQDIRQNNPFTTKQVQQLLKLLQESPNHSVNQIHRVNKEDSAGVTDHVTYDKNQFINFF